MRSHRLVVLAGILAGLWAAGVAAAAPRTEIVLNEPLVYPESITATPGGTVIFGSYTKPEIYRAKPGSATTEPWIHLTGEGALTTLGVLADSRSNTLWACVIERPSGGPPSVRSSLRSFDLKTGEARASVPLPGAINLCNDIAVAPDGRVYASDTIGGRVLRFDAAGRALEVWLEDPALKGIDGLTFLGSQLYVNTISTSRLYRVPIALDGKAGAPVQITLSQPLVRPDGMRAARGAIFVAENNPGNRVSMLKFDRDRATVTVLKDGLVTPTAVASTGDWLWIDESKLAYLQDPKLKGQDPGPIRALAIPMPR